MSQARSLPVLLACAALVLTLVGTAWLCDDAYFTLRTVENALAGHGLRWNVFERVQAYTHPAWMLVLLGAIGATGEHYLTTIAVSLAITLAAVAALVAASRPGMRMPVIALLLLSRAFVDYGTGGLENPLSHLLFALFLLHLARGHADDLLVPAFLVALAALTRLDAILVYAPVLAARSLRSLRLRGAARTLGILLLAFAPLVLWELFSLLYYGFLFPNTAYAKLGTGHTAGDLVPRGLAYLWNSLRNDPLTLPVVAVACALGLRRRGEDALLAVGVLLYLGYVVRIGGGFMSGRMVALPFFAAVGLLGRAELRAPARLRPALAWTPALAFLAGFFLHRLELALVPIEKHGTLQDGIADERLAYWSRTGLLRAGNRFRPEPYTPPPRKHRPGEVLWGWSGMQAFHAGSETIVVERYGLGDPLLARLPARFDPNWRVGHYERFVPLGYEERLLAGDPGLLKDAGLARYDALLRRVTSGSLLDLERLRIALELQLGRHDGWIDRGFYRYPLLRECELVEEEPGLWTEDGCLGPLADEGALLTSDEPLEVSAIEVHAHGGALESVQLLAGDVVVQEIVCEGPPPPDGRYSFACSEPAVTAIWVQPEPGPEDKHDAVRLIDVTVVASEDDSPPPPAIGGS